MKKITLKILVIILLPLIFCQSNLNAQGLMTEVSLEKQIERSGLVIEGEVIYKKSFWDIENKNIYTLNTIKVYKVFKGEVFETINVVTLGGVVGLKAEIVTPSLSLNKNSVGVFMLNSNTGIKLKSKSIKNQYMPYSSNQGFYKYNIYQDIASNPFKGKKGITTSFYKEIMSLTKTKYIDVASFDVEKKQSSMPKQGKSRLIPTSITFSPSTVSAGTQTVLTISGSGFGSTKGKIGFSEADKGGSSFIEALDTQVLTWTDTEITVEVPSGAGTGTIKVIDSADDSANSSSILTVSFSEINAVSNQAFNGPNAGLDVAYPVRHLSFNGAGGYTWQMFTGFDANAPAKSSFLRAFEKWRCETGINWVIGTPTDIDEIALDGVNVIRFDVGNELPDNFLGRCTSRYNGCFINGGASIAFYVEELDIVFNDSPDSTTTPIIIETWNFNTGDASSSEYDFETVTIHELGHGHQLGHVINSNNDVMHHLLSNGQNVKDLATNNIIAANNVQSRSISTGICGLPAMTNYAGTCGLNVEDNTLDNRILLYPNPAKQEFFIKSTIVNLEKAVIYDISGRLISIDNFSNNSTTKTISLRGVSKGVYFVNIYSENSSITKKLIVE